MFEQASRLRPPLRFETDRGLWSVEDLWDVLLSSTRGPNLDDIAKSLHRRLETTSISFVDDDNKPDARTQLAFDIVKHIIDVKKAENKVAAEARDKADKRQKIMAIMARKGDEELEGKSMDELRGLLDSL